jgi:NAD-dependent dihydropyrimidine dehydrogenase PreA subunit
MPYIIAQPCIGTKDRGCVDVCPVDCIYEGEDQLYIHPDECIDCGACVPACPVAAIYDSVEATPSHQQDLIEANSVYRSGSPDAVARAEAIVQVHIAAQATLMAVPPAERQAAHNVSLVRGSSE